MIKKLRNILNSYSDEEIENMELWVNAENRVDSFIIEEFSLVLITTDAELKINNVIDKEAKR